MSSASTGSSRTGRSRSTVDPLEALSSSRMGPTFYEVNLHLTADQLSNTLRSAAPHDRTTKATVRRSRKEATMATTSEVESACSLPAWRGDDNRLEKTFNFD